MTSSKPKRAEKFLGRRTWSTKVTPAAYRRARLLVRYGMPLTIFLVWAALYLPHLRTSPHWYGDETLTHYCSLWFSRGQPIHYALWNTFWSPHFPYQPIYCLVAGLFAQATGGDIIGSRFFNTLLALGVALIILRFGIRVLGIPAAFFASLLFLTYDQSIIHFRMVYAHNAVALGFLVACLFVCRRPSRRADLSAGLGLLVAAGAHPLFIHGALCSGLARLKRPRSWLPLALPSAIYLLITLSVLYFHFGDVLRHDLAQLYQTYTSRSGSDGGGGGWQTPLNIANFVTQDWFHIGAFLGLLACCNRRYYKIAIFVGGIGFLLLQNRQNLTLFYYQAVIFLPLMCLAWGVLVRQLFVWSRPIWDSRTAWSIGRWAPCLLPFVLLVLMEPTVVKRQLRPRDYYWTTQSIGEVETAAKWVNDHSTPIDLVICNQNIAWLLHSQTAWYLQVVTWYGLPTQGYELGNPREKFRYDSSLERAKYVVIGDIDQRWTIGQPNVIKLFETMQREQWPVVWRGQFYLIAANPRYLPRPNP